MKKIRVLVVDDSALVRHLLSEIINRQPDMQCVGAANDPLVAREMIRELNPDVLTLDVEMPRMDGLEFLGRLMRLRPMPVVMISTLTDAGADVTLRALELGAVDFFEKPRVGVAGGLSDLSRLIAEKIRVAATAKIRRVMGLEDKQKATINPLGRISTEKMIFIGASTGGTEAIREVLSLLPADAPAVDGWGSIAARRIAGGEAFVRTLVGPAPWAA